MAIRLTKKLNCDTILKISSRQKIYMIFINPLYNLLVLNFIVVTSISVSFLKFGIKSGRLNNLAHKETPFLWKTYHVPSDLINCLDTSVIFISFRRKRSKNIIFLYIFILYMILIPFFFLYVESLMILINCNIRYPPLMGSRFALKEFIIYEEVKKIKETKMYIYIKKKLIMYKV